MTFADHLADEHNAGLDGDERGEPSPLTDWACPLCGGHLECVHDGSKALDIHGKPQASTWEHVCSPPVGIIPSDEYGL